MAKTSMNVICFVFKPNSKHMVRVLRSWKLDIAGNYTKSSPFVIFLLEKAFYRRIIDTIHSNWFLVTIFCSPNLKFPWRRLFKRIHLKLRPQWSQYWSICQKQNLESRSKCSFHVLYVCCSRKILFINI